MHLKLYKICFFPLKYLIVAWDSHEKSVGVAWLKLMEKFSPHLSLLLHWPSHLSSSKEILSSKSFSLLISVFFSPVTLPPIPSKRNVHRKEKSMFKSLSLSHLSQSKRFEIMVFLLRLNICIFIEEVLLQHLKCRHFSISFLRIFSIQLLYFLSFYFQKSFTE